jgi:hypothetical protein
LVRVAAMEASWSASFRHFDPLRVLPERCLPAELVLPAQLSGPRREVPSGQEDGHVGHRTQPQASSGGPQSLEEPIAGPIMPSGDLVERPYFPSAALILHPGKRDYQGCIPSGTAAIMQGMNSMSKIGRLRLVLVEPQPWYATAPSSPLEHRREFEDERSRLFALAAGDHLPIELVRRAADLTVQLDRIA